jgi:hypothetical protein
MKSSLRDEKPATNDLSRETSQDCAQDDNIKARLVSAMEKRWTRRFQEDVQRVSACLPHARVTSRGSDCTGDSGVMLSTWQKCKRYARYSPFGL